MSQWRSWIARPPPKGQVAGSNPAWDTNKTKRLKKQLGAHSGSFPIAGALNQADSTLTLIL